LTPAKRTKARNVDLIGDVRVLIINLINHLVITNKHKYTLIMKRETFVTQ